MPDPATYLAFLAAVLAYQLAGPGPDMVVVMSRGVAEGKGAALATAFGCVGAGIVQVPLLALGLASLVASSPLAFELLRWAGAAYLLYLGLRLLLTRRNESRGDAPPRTTGHGRAFCQGFITNLTNPATLAFMLAILPQFTEPAAGPAWRQFVILGATMKATGTLTLGAVALLSGGIGGWLSRRPALVAWQERAAGATLVALGLYLLLAGTGAKRS